MPDVKWIKITTDIFDDEKILLIESLPESDSIIVIWFKLLCLAGKMNNSGVFVLNDKIPYTIPMLATIFRRKEATVKLALETFTQFGMVEIVDDVITIPNWGKHQSMDQLENKKNYMRNYMNDYRKKQKEKAALTEGRNGGKSTNTGGCKTNCKTNSKSNVSRADKDIDIDIDLYINNKSKKEIKTKEDISLLGGAEKPSVFALPLNTGESFQIYQDDVDKWSGLYPAVDVMQQLRNMYGWLDSNPSKRKTKNGIRRFITSWLSREQDRGQRNGFVQNGPNQQRKTFDPVTTMSEEEIERIFREG